MRSKLRTRIWADSAGALYSRPRPNGVEWGMALMPPELHFHPHRGHFLVFAYRNPRQNSGILDVEGSPSPMSGSIDRGPASAIPTS